MIAFYRLKSLSLFIQDKASASQVVTSASLGIRPPQTNFSLITNPGVDRIGYFLISGHSVTWMSSASTPIMEITLRAMVSTFWQFSHPGPKTLIVSIAVLLL